MTIIITYIYINEFLSAALPKTQRQSEINSWSPINLQQVVLSNKG